ncbi:hypothetical protein ACGFZL_04245 [Streptomyces sp. NPDC048182]|uniref:hypothetical protein n=1 Tax=Streptomyces sp. NPDC048182 TaxID=3365507 RepID=UPI003722E2F7
MPTEQLVRFQVSDLVANSLADRLPRTDPLSVMLREAPRRPHGAGGQAAVFPEATFEEANQLRAHLLDMAHDIRTGRYRCNGVTYQSAQRCANQVRTAMFVSNAYRGQPGTEGIEDFHDLRHWKMRAGSAHHSA